jgi:hypothetical protein
MSITIFFVLVLIVLAAAFVGLAANGTKRAAGYELLRLLFGAAALGLFLYFALRGHPPL